MKIVDTKGQVCPKPIIETKKILNQVAVGEMFMVITDNETSFNNLKRFLNDNHSKVNAKREGDVWSLEVTKLHGEIKDNPAEEYCTPEVGAVAKGDYIIAISSDCMGHGEEELGRKLMVSFISIILYLDELPSAIVLYNSGVKLAVKDSVVIEYLAELEKHNVAIVVCGTCVDYYGISNYLGAGTINDMLTITNRLIKAKKIIRP
jgi:selenium metabolism protein YedF